MVIATSSADAGVRDAASRRQPDHRAEMLGINRNTLRRKLVDTSSL
jgi:DNA-binding protein Fis